MLNFSFVHPWIKYDKHNLTTSGCVSWWRTKPALTMPAELLWFRQNLLWTLWLNCCSIDKHFLMCKQGLAELRAESRAESCLNRSHRSRKRRPKWKLEELSLLLTGGHQSKGIAARQVAKTAISSPIRRCQIDNQLGSTQHILTAPNACWQIKICGKSRPVTAKGHLKQSLKNKIASYSIVLYKIVAFSSSDSVNDREGELQATRLILPHPHISRATKAIGLQTTCFGSEHLNQ